MVIIDSRSRCNNLDRISYCLQKILLSDYRNQHDQGNYFLINQCNQSPSYSLLPIHCGYTDNRRSTQGLVALFINRPIFEDCDESKEVIMMIATKCCLNCLYKFVLIGRLWAESVNSIISSSQSIRELRTFLQYHYVHYYCVLQVTMFTTAAFTDTVHYHCVHWHCSLLLFTDTIVLLITTLCKIYIHQPGETDKR